VRSYLDMVDGSPLLPAADEQSLLLNIFLLEKAIYELGYELNNRPSWSHIPMRGILNLLASSELTR
jgi:maltose alpha-D-glucosyltransferase / alpha-amylase